MKQKRNRLFKLLMSAVFALGTLSSAAPALANEDTSFEETMISDTFNETEQTSTGFEEMEEDETQPDLEEESAEAGDLITGQLPQPDMNIKETARSAEKIMRTTDRKYAAERNILVDEGIPGISNQYFPPNTPIWRDDRKKVTNTRKFPNYAICKLYMTFEDKRGNEYYYCGTGFYVSPTEILTCAHCVYDKPNGYGLLTHLIIAPGNYNYNKPYDYFDSWYDPINYQMPKVYQTTSSTDTETQNDYCILQMPEPVKNRKYIRLSGDAGKSKKVHLIGYPALARGDDSGENQYEDWSTKTRNDRKCLESDVTGSGGQSGSPILNTADEAVAIHGYSYGDDKYDYQWGGGVRFTLDLLHTLDVSFKGKNGIETPVYRCYNPNSGEHVYTKNYYEVKNITKVGWKYEGVSWRHEERSGGTPVYRLYNPNAGDHHYTINKNEYNALRKAGWRGEGVVWHAPKNDRNYRTVYRLYNPNAKKAGAHHFTTDRNEYNALCRVGWKGEGKAFNAR